MTNVHFMYSPERDWVGMYIEGELQLQGHRIGAGIALEILAGETPELGLTVTASSMTEGQVKARRCPKVLPKDTGGK